MNEDSIILEISKLESNLEKLREERRIINFNNLTADEQIRFIKNLIHQKLRKSMGRGTARMREDNKLIRLEWFEQYKKIYGFDFAITDVYGSHELPDYEPYLFK